MIVQVLGPGGGVQSIMELHAYTKEGRKNNYIKEQVGRRGSRDEHTIRRQRLCGTGGHQRREGERKGKRGKEELSWLALLPDSSLY